MIGRFYEVDQIMGRRKINNKYEYLIKWKGYSISESTWEPGEKLFTIQDLIKDYDDYCDKKEKKKKNRKRGKKKDLKRENDEQTNVSNKKLDMEEDEKKEKEENVNKEDTKQNIDKEEEKDSSEKKPYFLLDNSIDKILAIKLEKNKLMGIVERRNEDGKVYTEKISTEDIKKTNPWVLVDFYESKIVFS